MSPRGHRPDPVDRFELFDGRGAEADRAVRFSRRGGDRRLPLFGDEDLLAVGEPRRQVDRFQRRVGPGAAGAPDASVTRAPAGNR